MHERLIRATLAAAAVAFSATVLLAQNAVTIPPVPQLTWESCDEMHDVYVQRFAKTPGFGVSRMGQPPMLDRSGVLDLGRARYSIERLELIGALRPDEPVAYLVGALGPDGSITTYAQPGHGVTARPAAVNSRAITNFEKDSLAAFHSGRDIASAAGPAGSLRCIGSLRAKETCVTCHKSRTVGDLLGAFTYQLRSLPRQH